MAKRRCSPRQKRHGPRSRRLHCERLESRWMLSGIATQVLGVSEWSAPLPVDSDELGESASLFGGVNGLLSAGPGIERLVVEPSQVTAGGTLKLTAEGVDGSAARVAFYRDLSGTGELSFGNDSFVEAVELGPLTASQQWQELTIHDADDEDHFRFEILPSGDKYRFEFQFDQPAGDFQVDLYDSMGEYLESAYSLSDRSQLDLRGLPPGSYSLVVSSLGNVGRYDMAIVSVSSIAPDRFEPNTDFASAHDLGSVTSPRTWNGLTLHERFEGDYFRFEIQPDQDAFEFQMRVNNPPPGFLFLSASVFAEGSSGSREAWSWTTGEVRLPLQGLEPGPHFLVLSSNSPIPSYSLSLRAAEPVQPDRFEPNDTFATAHSLGAIRGPRSLPDLTIHDAFDEDMFRFEIVPNQDAYAIDIQFGYERADFDITLFNADQTPIRSASSWASGRARLGLQGLKPGFYYASVFPTDEWIDHYDFSIVAAEPIKPDRFEPNNSLSTAYSLGTITGPNAWDDLTLHDHDEIDLFRFELPPGDGAYEFEIVFQDEHANFDVSIVDENDQWVRLAGSWGRGRAQVGLQGLEPGTYFLEIVSWDGQVGTYQLAVRNADPIPPDRFEADQRLGVDASGSDGWSWTGTTTGWPGGSHTVFAVAQNDDGVWGPPVSANVQIGSWQNPRNRFDVNDDGFVSAIDVLLILNEINHSGTGPLPPRTAENQHLGYLDVNGDGNLTPLDALQVINHINYGMEGESVSGGSAEGEAGWLFPTGMPTAGDEVLVQPDLSLLSASQSPRDTVPYAERGERSRPASRRLTQGIPSRLSGSSNRNQPPAAVGFDLFDHRLELFEGMEEFLHGLS